MLAASLKKKERKRKKEKERRKKRKEPKEKKEERNKKERKRKKEKGTHIISVSGVKSREGKRVKSRELVKGLQVTGQL